MQEMSRRREETTDANTSMDLITVTAAPATAPTQGMGIKEAAVWNIVAAEEAALSAVEGAIWQRGERGSAKC